jgi:hypothetical protein
MPNAVTPTRISLFAEDKGLENYIGELTRRVSEQYKLHIDIDAVIVHGGHGRVFARLRAYLADIEKGLQPIPHILIVAIDANKRGVNSSKRRIDEIIGDSFLRDFVVRAIPDPHIERWMLLDSLAFKSVFGRGCNAPDKRFEKARYKKLLIEAIKAAGTKDTFLGGMEYAHKIVRELDLDRVRSIDDSFGKLMDELEAAFTRIVPAP